MTGYAVRQLNPFTGVLQLVETPAARAVTDNGVQWRLQVMAARPEHTWRSANRQSQHAFFNWALWSPERGMYRVNANPIMDLGAMQKAADELIEALQAHLPQLPFQLADRFEYWCCDERGKPVALIGSTTDARYVDAAPDTTWQATTLEENGFVSESLARGAYPNNDRLSPRAHARRLENEVRKRAPSCYWFERQADGSGHRLDTTEALNRADFPALGIQTNWQEPLVESLFRDYIAWLSPLLLLLPLEREQRARLEKLARGHSAEVADHYRLYPDIVQPDLIEQARVEARLRRS